MDNDFIQFLYNQWLTAKFNEKQAQERRRELEDKIIAELDIDLQSEGSKTITDGRYKVKIATRFTRSVDSDLLQEVAAEHGLSSHLGTLFRWKPEINAKEWRNASQDITQPLQVAITTKPGRPSFSIEQQES